MSEDKTSFKELLARIKALEARVENLENNSTKSTPKKKLATCEPVALPEIITLLEKETWVCTHCFKTGKNKDKFCSSVSKLHYKGELITDNTTITKEYYGEIRCSKHSNGSTNKGINHGAKLIAAHYGIQDSDSVVTKDEENPDEKVAALLGGNSAGIVTTPSKAFADKSESKNYIEYGEEHLHEIVEKEGNVVVIQHSKSKNGTPKKRPSPCIIGVCKIEEKDDYLNHLIKPPDSIQASVGLKYNPLGEVEEIEEKKEDISAGLTAVKQPVVLNPPDNPDPYENNTDPEEEKDDDLDGLLDDLS